LKLLWCIQRKPGIKGSRVGFISENQFPSVIGIPQQHAKVKLSHKVKAWSGKVKPTIPWSAGDKENKDNSK